ncbi:hypothetical protein GCM10027403_16280 [Arthrobacter tecti]
MKKSLLTSCALAATLLLAGCGGSNESSPDAGSSAPSTEPTTTAPAEPVSKAELEARVAGVKDVLGDPLEVVPTDQAAAGMEKLKSALEGAEVEPAECKDQALGNMASSGEVASQSVAGMGAANESGGILVAVLLDGSTEDALEQGFGTNREALEECSSVTMTIAGTTVTSTTEELPQQHIGVDSFALLTTQELGPEQMIHTLIVSAHADGVIVSVQTVGATKPDAGVQEQLADIAAQLLEPSTK